MAQDYPAVAVIGLDREAMLAEAGRRAARLGVDIRWLPGQAEAIPLPDDAVDACMTERVLKYLGRPAAAIAEMARVLRPGGRIACFELDYAGTILGGDPEAAGAVGDLLNASVGEARMGRRLPGLLHDAGFADITVEAVCFCPPRMVYETIVAEPVRAAIATGRLEAAPAQAWLEQQAEAAASELFAAAFVGFLVGGRLGR